ncbi:FkbM family methyltransferase [Herminiimonas aquatilis]|uniref:FkbM family methyltransferase n=1 Tax=Herminiimonas aquatilis TaxID=345342 RepID=A0ABW2J9B2_9BURK
MPAFKNYIFKFAKLLERTATAMQGKGYGAATIEQEVKLVLQLLDLVPQLGVDIGGNVGNYTAELRRRYPSLEIHTFEPSATNVQKLKARFGNDELVKLVPYAVSDAEGTASLFANQPGSGLGSLTKRKLEHFNIDFSHQETIQTVRFEDYWKDRLNKRRLDIVKIDIEGHELNALNGFGTALHQTRIVQFEFGGCNIDTHTYFQDFWYFFKDQNFDLFRITPIGVQKIQRYAESEEFFATTNYIAVNRRV